ncbi:MAG: hypothetical protein M1840_002436 [Geoglossum simile]|nr:MAG: hypothetical protein M1840_002436 [Geoglossum simile]
MIAAAEKPPHDYQGYTSDNLSDRLGSQRRNIGRPRAREMQDLGPSIASTQLEGSEGQIAEMGSRGRGSSALGQQLIRKGRSDSNLIGRSGLGQRAIRDTIGRDTSAFETSAASKALLETLSQKHDESKTQPKKHYLPRLVLRPIDPPEDRATAKGGSRPSVQSVTNSYRLDSGTVDQVAANCASCRAALGSADLEHEAMFKGLPTTATANTLLDMIPLLSPTPSIYGSQTAGSDAEASTRAPVRSRSSSVSTRSRGITYQALLKRSPSASDVGLPLPPVLSQGTAHDEYSTKRLNLNKSFAGPKATASEDKPLIPVLRGIGPKGPPRANLESGGTFIDVLNISASGAARSSSADGDLAENKTLSDYSSRPTVEEESVNLNNVSTHAAISYEKLIVRQTLGEGSTAILTAPLETESPEPEGNPVGTEEYVLPSGNVSNIPQIMVNSSVQSPASLNSSPGGHAQTQQIPTDLKGVDLDWSTPTRRGTNAGTRRTPGSSGSSESYTDSDASSAGSFTEQKLSHGITFRDSMARKNRRYSSSDVTEAASTARLGNYRSYSQGASRRASIRSRYPGALKPEAGGPTKWIRQLLRRRTDESKPGSPPSNLTARPPRRSRTTPLPAMPRNVTDPSPPARNSAPGTSSGSRNQASETGTQFQRDTSDRFNKMILELEVLLSEALHLAKEASERQISQQLPQILQEATSQLNGEAISNTPTSLSRKSLVQSPAAMNSKTSPVPSIPTKSRRQSTFTQNRSRSHSNRLASNGSPGQMSSAIPSPIIRRSAETRAGQIDGRIFIIQPPSPKHTPSTRKSTADHLPTPYPNASEISLADTIERPELPSKHQAVPRPVRASPPHDGSNATSTSNEWLPALRSGSQRQVRRSETGVLSDRSYQHTPPRFYEGKEHKTDQGPRQSPDSPHTAHEISRNQNDTLRKQHAVRLTVKDDNRTPSNLPSRDDIRRHIKQYNSPPIQPRHSSSGLRQFAYSKNDGAVSHKTMGFPSRKRRGFSGHVLGGHHEYPGHSIPTNETPSGDVQHGEAGGGSEGGITRKLSLSNRHHISLRGARHFSLRRSHRRQPISRDWSTMKKRFTAAVACISTALVGVIVGVYAGEVPAIQYQITDLHHYAILGNVFLYIGLAIPTLCFWPLPLLHGRKPYTLMALALLMPLQFPQGLVVGTQRSPYVAGYRATLLTVRLVSGIVLGFANINFKATLLDLFGSSLQSGNPHQERVVENDVRRHGGGMGVWLGIWSWCYTGSIGVGFLLGALIIGGADPDWGFWLVMILVAFVLLLNVLTPEVRRSAYRRSVAEVLKGSQVSRRVARGEIKMHISSTGPKWWWEEAHAGLVLSLRMMRQPGFTVVALYSSWIYGQVVMVVVLLGALTSKYYHFRPPYVGLCVSAVPIGSLLAVPFQLASLFSRARRHPQRTDSDTFEKRVTWSSHLVRRGIFLIALPFANLAYTLASGGKETHFMVPTMLAGLIGFLSILAISECNGLIMETFDTSDLQRPTVAGIRRLTSDAEKAVMRRTNYSCYPRVSSAFAIIHAMGFVTAAIATATGGVVERRIGAQAATGVVTGILLLLTAALSAVLWRWKEVQVVPDLKYMGKGELLENEDEWEPVIIGNPSGKMRRMSILELGGLSRWSEIRQLNKILAETGMSRWNQVRHSLRGRREGRGNGGGRR